MHLRSKGLGRKELVMDFREYDISRHGDDVIVSGTIREPVTWDFSIRFSQSDIPGMLRVGLSRPVLRMALRWILRRPARSPEDTPAWPAAPAPSRVPRKTRVRRTVDDASPLVARPTGKTGPAGPGRG